MYNAGLSLFSALPGDDGAPVWLDPDSTTIPWWLRVPWSFLGHGHGRLGVFLLLVAVCLLVDAARLTSRPAANLTGQVAPRWVARSVPAAPGPVRSVLSAVMGLVWVVPRDLAQAVMGLARRPPEELGHPAEPRRAAAARGAALVSGQRALRELAYEHASGRTHPWARRLAAAAVLAGLGWLAFAAAPATAREIGDSTSTVFDMPGSGPSDRPSGRPTDLPSMPSMPPLPSGFPMDSPTELPTWMPMDLPTGLPSGFPSFDPNDFPTLDPDFELPGNDLGTGPWLAGLLDTIAGWWHDQPLIAQLAIGAGIAALVVLSGGSLGLALGVSGVLTWGLDKSAGIATFTRDPQQATRDYFATATPTQLAADTLGVALTFAPGNFATAKVVRSTADGIMSNPAVWLNGRRETFDRHAPTPDPPTASVIWGRQEKHFIGHPSWRPGKSPLTADPRLLVQRAGMGTPVGHVPRGEPGFKERIDYGDEIIGSYFERSTGELIPTTVGILHYGAHGIHVVPGRPRGWG